MSGSESKWKTAVRVLIQLVLVVVVLFIGVKLFKKMLSMRKPPEKKAVQVSAPLLNALAVYPGDMQMQIGGFGTVGSKIEVKVVPQVSGIVVDCHDNLVDGGFFKADDALIVIDKADYEVAVESAEAVVARAQVLLDQELAEATVARQEWDQLHPGTEPTSPLVLRKPQISQAKAELKAAVAQLAKAQLNLKRTVISMPFAGRVQAESVDIGQYLMSGQAVATVYGTDAVEIVVPLEDRDLQWFSIPESNSDPSGRSSGHNSTEAVVAATFAGAEHLWEGKVVRTQGRIDPSSRMVNVVVEVQEPFKLSGGRP
ncbi:MAG: HlyD family efflux transporter periplasmic adaptor subunit, partial [Planctomycetes bacterium]|nr:HlyD family efflux transporter periplasmic adaptor subunit [Planctomycetota bacterium]